MPARVVCLTKSGEAVCRLSVEVTEPALVATGVLKAQVRPVGRLAGQENVNAEALRAVVPIGVTVTSTVAAVFAAMMREAGLSEAVNAAARLTESVAGKAPL